jgi:hypothetical protein
LVGKADVFVGRRARCGARLDIGHLRRGTVAYQRYGVKAVLRKRLCHRAGNQKISAICGRAIYTGMPH